MNETSTPDLKVIISGVNINNQNFEYSMAELAELAKANNMEVVGEISQNAERPVAGTYFGKGKIEEIKFFANDHHAQAVIVNAELSPTQIRNLEKQLELPIVDRTQLILEIFANRAKTKLAKTQVEIAQLEYQLPRLHSTDLNLSQQRGGSATNRGAGETQLELNRRTISKRIAHLKRNLEKIKEEQETQRKQRIRNEIPLVALVGYTNAGKSSTMNGILKATSTNDEEDKTVFEKNMLFATLDTSVRAVALPDKRQFLLSDTVGFVSDLPHNLVEAFQATLEEAKQADLLINVVDYSDPNYPEMIQTTVDTLKQIHAPAIPTIEAYNKADLRPDTPYPSVQGNTITYSAKDPKSITELLKLIEEQIYANYRTLDLLIPYTDGKAMAALAAKATILNQTPEETGTRFQVSLNPKDVHVFEQFEIK